MIACEDEHDGVVDVLLKKEATVALRNKVSKYADWVKCDCVHVVSDFHCSVG